MSYLSRNMLQYFELRRLFRARENLIVERSNTREEET
jgi:hypothetical protein